MPSHEQPPRRRDARSEYSYRRSLTVRELLPAVGVGIGVGVFAFYVTKLLLQRTPLSVGPSRRARIVEESPHE